ncbi:MAG: efflux RND transporter periplasmic adaptor subunit [Alphaproteobacteria bacterium]|nr:efflux RND transporter periplasmic adaptor subunit [Alphaproteobacteria bacterium]
MQRPMSASGWIGFGAAASLLLLTACQPGTDDAAASEASVPAPAAPVETVTVAPSTSAGAIRASGLVAYKRETALSFGAPGEIETLVVDEGDTVSVGQTLATLRRTTVGVDAEESAIARKTAQLQLDRTQTLFDKGFASEAALDNARLALERVRESAAIQAPASGVILRRTGERGQIVNAGDPVLWVGETRSGVIVRASATSGEVALVRTGDPVEVIVRDRAAFAGKVARIAAKSSDATGVFEIEVLLDAPGDLRSGEVAEVLIRGQTAEGVEAPFAVPALSLIDARADQGVVFVVDAKGMARRRAVETGGVSDAGVIVLKGLNAGDVVITRGASMVRDGDPVRVVGQ